MTSFKHDDGFPGEHVRPFFEFDDRSKGRTVPENLTKIEIRQDLSTASDLPKGSSYQLSHPIDFHFTTGTSAENDRFTQRDKGSTFFREPIEEVVVTDVNRKIEVPLDPKDRINAEDAEAAADMVNSFEEIPRHPYTLLGRPLVTFGSIRKKQPQYPNISSYLYPKSDSEAGGDFVAEYERPYYSAVVMRHANLDNETQALKDAIAYLSTRPTGPEVL